MARRGGHHRRPGRSGGALRMRSKAASLRSGGARSEPARHLSRRPPLARDQYERRLQPSEPTAHPHRLQRVLSPDRERAVPAGSRVGDRGRRPRPLGRPSDRGRCGGSGLHQEETQGRGSPRSISARRDSRDHRRDQARPRRRAAGQAGRAGSAAQGARRIRGRRAHRPRFPRAPAARRRVAPD